MILGQSNRQQQQPSQSVMISQSPKQSTFTNNLFASQNSTSNTRTNQFFTSLSPNAQSTGFLDKTPYQNSLFSSQIKLKNDSVQPLFTSDLNGPRNVSNEQRRHSLTHSNISNQQRNSQYQQNLQVANNFKAFSQIPLSPQHQQFSSINQSASKLYELKATGNGQTFKISNGMPTVQSDYQLTGQASGNTDRPTNTKNNEEIQIYQRYRYSDDSLRLQLTESQKSVSKLLDENDALTRINESLVEEGASLKDQLKILKEERLKVIHRMHEEEKMIRMRERINELEEENLHLKKQFSDIELALLEKEATVKTYQDTLIQKTDSSTERIINLYIENEEKYKKRIKELDKDIKKYSNQISELTLSLSDQQGSQQQKELIVQQLQNSHLNEKVRLQEENRALRKQMKSLQEEQENKVQEHVKSEEDNEKMLREGMSQMNKQLDLYTEQLNLLQEKYDHKAEDYKNTLYDSKKKEKEIKELSNNVALIKKEKDDILEKLKMMIGENEKLAEVISQKGKQEQQYELRLQQAEILHSTVQEQNNKIRNLETKIKDFEVFSQQQITVVQKNQDLNVKISSNEQKILELQSEIKQLQETIEDKNEIILKKAALIDEKISALKQKEQQLLSTQENLNSTNNKLDNSKKQIELLQQQVQQLEKEADILKEQIEFQQEQIKLSEQQKRDFDEKLEIHNQFIEQKNERMAENQELIDSLQVSIQQLRQAYQSAQEDLNQKEELITQLTSSIDNLQSVIQQVGSDQVAEINKLKENQNKEVEFLKMLNSELEKEYIKKIEEKNSRINTTEDRIKFYKKEVSQLNIDSKGLEEQINLKNEEIANLSKRMNDLTTELDNHSSSLKESKLIQQIQEEKLTTYTTQISECQNEVQAKQLLISKLSISSDFHSNVEKQLQIFEQKIKELEAERVDLNVRINNEESFKIEANQKIVLLEEKLQFAENTLLEKSNLLELKEKELNVITRKASELEKHSNISNLQEGFSFIKSTYEFLKDKEQADEKLRETEQGTISHKLSEYEIQITQFDNLVKEYTTQIQHLKQINQKQDSDIVDYKSKLVNMQDTLNSSIVDKSKVEEELEDIRELNSDLQNKVSNIIQEMAQYKSESQSTKEEMKNLQQNLQMRKENHTELQKKLFETNQQLAYALNQLQQQSIKSRYNSPIKSITEDSQEQEEQGYSEHNFASNNNYENNQQPFYTNNDTLVSQLSRSPDSNE